MTQKNQKVKHERCPSPRPDSYRDRFATAHAPEWTAPPECFRDVHTHALETPDEIIVKSQGLGAQTRPIGGGILERPKFATQKFLASFVEYEYAKRKLVCSSFLLAFQQ